MSKPVVGVAGMTHLGLITATAIASRGFEVLGYDADAALVGRLHSGDFPVLELGLKELLAANGSRQIFSSSLADIGRCDVLYVAPDVPTDDEGLSDLGPLRALVDMLSKALKPGAVLVVLSQVEPGFTRKLAAPDPAHRYYQVETLVFGIAVERATQPERYIVGCADPAQPIHPALRSVLEAFGCPILPMRYESAELAKISINLCLVSSVSVANTLSELCEAIGADWSEIAPSLKLDRRIGPYSYLAPGLGISGGNLERDLATIRRLSDANGTDAGFVHACIRNSRHRRDWPLRTLHQHVLPKLPNPVIGVLGVTYKENTHSIKNSPAVALIRQLGGMPLRSFDPAVKASPEWHDQLLTVESMEAACDGVDCLMIMTPWPAFRELDPAAVMRRMRGRSVIDPYAILDRNKAADAGLDHHVLGAAPNRIST